MFFRSIKREREAGGLKPIAQSGASHQECLSRISRAITCWHSGVIDASKALRCVTLVVGAGDEYEPLSASADPLLVKIRNTIRDKGQTTEAAYLILGMLPNTTKRPV